MTDETNGELDFMEVQLGRNQDVDEWMKLVEEISWNFPGLETKEGLDEYRETLLRFIGKEQALCVRNDIEVMGAMSLS